MKLIKEEGNYWIIQLEQYILMLHRVMRQDTGYAEFCVGELLPNEDGSWEVWVSKSYRNESECGSQKVIGKCRSQHEAIELLWEQRKLMHWGYYQ